MLFKPKCFQEVKGYGIKPDIPNKCNGEIDNSTLMDCVWSDQSNEKPQFEEKCRKCRFLYKDK